jgi:hypothetical protein
MDDSMDSETLTEGLPDREVERWIKVNLEAPADWGLWVHNNEWYGYEEATADWGSRVGLRVSDKAGEV